MSSRGKPDKGQVQVPVVWVDLDQTPIEFLNQFALQKEGEEYILSLGALAPPFLVGTEEERLAQVREVRFVPIRVLGRYGMTEARIKEFSALLVRFLEQQAQRRENTK